MQKKIFLLSFIFKLSLGYEEQIYSTDKNVSKTLDNQTIRKIKNEAYLEL